MKGSDRSFHAGNGLKYEPVYDYDEQDQNDGVYDPLEDICAQTHLRLDQIKKKREVIL